jgi:sterol desaturase/sphingolipid hydroxylase (fatty acid hydroxylase superfamily)
MKRILGLSVALLILSVLFGVIESLFSGNPTQPRLHRRRGFATDLMYWFTTPLVTAIGQIGLVLILIVIYRKDFVTIRQMFMTPGTGLAHQPAWLQAIEMIFISDFMGYWIHRWFHGRRMWKFHAIHHCSKDLDWLSAVRVHPINDTIPRWIQASTLVLMGFNPMAVAAYLPFLTFYAIFIHSNVSWEFGRLKWLIASPRFHRWHHTCEDAGLDKNFAGLFPFIDVLFGTFYMPNQAPVQFGLRGDEVPQRFFQQLIYPFRTIRGDRTA